MNDYLLDTNVIIDFASAEILKSLNFENINVSSVVLREEILKQLPDFNFESINIINESYLELEEAYKYKMENKKISFYDALNLCIAKNRKMQLVTGDQQLIKFAVQKEVKCFGTIKLLELMVELKKIDVNECIKALEKINNDLKRRLPKNLVNETIKVLKEKYKEIKI